MEILTDAIEQFVNPTDSSGNGSGNGSGYGNGSGNGSGYGNGSGCGYGYGSGNGYGNGSGYGYGNGSGNGSGCGDGYGYGSGNGSGNGDGYGYGNGNDILSYCGQLVYDIDGIPTVVQKVKGNLAKGYIINSDLTTKPCYIAKGNGCFAHGDTFRAAQEALRNKIFADMDPEEAIDEFLKTFKLGEKYPAKDFYEWHHILTGSCEFGRNAFVKNHRIDLEKDTYTVEEFIEITKHDYGGNIIEQLKDRIGGKS